VLPSPLALAAIAPSAGAASFVDDAALAARAQKDEAGAFSALYARHARYIAGVAYRLMGDDGDVDDVVQETFLDAADGIHALADPAAVRAWLVTIAVRRVKRLLARRRRRRFLFWQFAEMAPRSSDPRDRAPVDGLYDALDTLPIDLRVPWVLSRIEQVTLAEVARICDVSLATIKRRIADADARIERRIAP
jgi:RNA polymerase sigma-70 factor, ECF subfamily